ncbi:MAG: TonB family protein [Planctomycetes bacterium]|nr:TonB family protein [Planctomycetota bacterium]
MIIVVAREARRRWRTAAALAVAVAVNAGLAWALVALAQFDPSTVPPVPAVPAPLEVAWLEVQPRAPEAPAPRVRPDVPPERSATAVPELSAPSPAPAAPPAPPLSLSVTLALPDLPALLVDPAASIESLDLDVLTLQPAPAVTEVVSPALPSGPRSEEGVDVPPRKRFTPEPPFPPLALRRAVREGRVIARLLVTATGEVAEVVIEDAAPRGYFERVVESTVREWMFEPARLDGRAVACWCRQTFQFQLEGK